MVRFKRPPDLYDKPQLKCFNSTMVRFKPRSYHRLREYVPGFNSTMVRFKRGLTVREKYNLA